jgi:molybdopterin-containing oxidoreductase family iron-sulfur binding subunit
VTADNRLRLEAGQVGHFLRAVATALFERDPDLAGYGIQNAIRVSPSGGPDWGDWPDAVAEALLSQRGRSLVVVGKRQPGWVHALAHLLNDRLDNIGETVQYIPHDVPDAGSLAELARTVGSGGVSTLLILGGNPAYTAPAELGFGELLERVDHSIHLGLYRDETAGQCRWHLPASHYLEAWGDLVATDGTIAVQQPLIAPIMPGGTRSAADLLGRLLLATGADLGPEAAETDLERDLGHPLVRATHRGRTNTDDFERTWREWIHDGVVGIAPPRPAQPRFNYRELVAAVTELGSGPPPAASEANLEINFAADPCLHDGRYANNGWLQELPDPLTKLTWDNAALISPKTARDRRLDNGDMVALSLGGRQIEVPVWKAPGTADNVVVLPLGYGRRWGNVAEGAGFDVYPLRTGEALYFKSGARLEKTGEHYTLATTQEHGYLRARLTRDRRPLVRETTVEVYRDREHPEHFEEVMHDPGAHHATPATQLFHESNVQTGQQWGMTIDLTRCTGCSACVVACQAENNISIVGKERVLQGREMHWIRIDRYYTAEIPPGTSADQAQLAMDDPQAVVQPIPCMHCELAPCETVCPVGATVHSPSGLNDMAYNRCIGTRYCSNNCPYKVRRFNYFNFTKENDKRFPLHRMQKNPDVTLRFRGVMEKCTYCVQRINRATIDVHVRGSDVVPDGAIVPACAQACPTRAIVFGDIADPRSEVSQLKASDRDYTLLAELNNRPRTSYAAKLRNPNPRLV